MDTQTFASLMTQERTHIQDAIKAARARQREAEHEITQLEAQLAAISAYEAALKGKGTTAAPRGRRAGRREEIVSLIAQHPEGMTRAEILEAMHAHGDKTATQSISNALSALKRVERLHQEGRKYHTTATPTTASASTTPGTSPL